MVIPVECHGSEELKVLSVIFAWLQLFWFVEICLENLYVDIGASRVHKVQVHGSNLRISETGYLPHPKANILP